MKSGGDLAVAGVS